MGENVITKEQLKKYGVKVIKEKPIVVTTNKIRIKKK